MKNVAEREEKKIGVGDSKKPYSKPEVVVLGTIEAKTNAGSIPLEG